MKKFTTVLILMLAILNSCTQDSALSDVEINDPSVIAPFIAVSRNIDNNNIFSSKIIVWLYDKNGCSIELKKGEVRLNHTRMLLKRLAITNAPYYSGENSLTKVELNANYTIEIELGDGKVYAASVQTQAKDLNQLTLPSYYSKQNNMNISWKDIYLHDNMEVQLIRYFSADSSGGQSFKTIPLPLANISTGNYILSKDNFNLQEGNCYKALITVSGTKNGVIDSRLNLNSKIVSVYSVAKEIIIH